MNLIDLSFQEAGENLQYDEQLLDRLEQSPPGDLPRLEVLRFWECSTPAVVLGRGGNITTDVHADVCAAKGIPVLRRASGGGAVVIGPGCLNYSLLLSLQMRPKLLSVRHSYELILGTVIEALGCGEVEIRGLSDLALRGRKISGNAQRRTGRALLHQGTILYNFDARVLAHCLPFPARHPGYRNGRPHGEFVTNFPMAPEEFKTRLSNVWLR